MTTQNTPTDAEVQFIRNQSDLLQLVHDVGVSIRSATRQRDDAICTLIDGGVPVNLVARRADLSPACVRAIYHGRLLIDCANCGAEDQPAVCASCGAHR